MAMKPMKLTAEWLREQISDLEIQPVVSTDNEARLVRDRNYTVKARVLDGVLLDELWQIYDRAAALEKEQS